MQRRRHGRQTRQPLRSAKAIANHSPTRYIKLTIAYDGTDFHGWQVQKNKPTVQGEIINVLRRLTQENITLHGAGRTDAGVHALGQIGSFRTQSTLTAGEFQRALNAILPPTIRIMQTEETGPQFNARWSAKGKIYRYRIYRGKVVPPHVYRYVLHYPFPLNEDAMREATALFVGTHDFSSFAASTGSEEDDKERSMEREVYAAELLRAHDPYDSDNGGLVERVTDNLEETDVGGLFGGGCGFAAGERLLVCFRGKETFFFFDRLVNIPGRCLFGNGIAFATDTLECLECFLGILVSCEPSWTFWDENQPEELH